MVQVHTATILTDLLIGSAKTYMREVGSLFPFFILMKQGSPMFVETDAEEIVNVQNDTDPELEDTYRSVVYMRMDRDEDALTVQPIARHLAETYAPDAIAFVVPSYYKLSYDVKPDELYSLDKDPESLTVLYVTLYMADESAGYLRVIPYVNMGDETSQDKIEKGCKHRIHFMDYIWGRTDLTMKGRFENPFSKE